MFITIATIVEAQDSLAGFRAAFFYQALSGQFVLTDFIHPGCRPSGLPWAEDYLAPLGQKPLVAYAAQAAELSGAPGNAQMTTLPLKPFARERGLPKTLNLPRPS